MEVLNEQWQAALAGAGIYGILREVVAIGLRIYAAKLRGDKNPSNDAVADVIDDAAKRLDEKR
jgi:hypothetical protein